MDFIEQAKLKFPQFDYSQTVFKNMKTRVFIGCPVHNQVLVNPFTFLRSVYGCPLCRKDDQKKNPNRKYSQEQFIEKAKGKFPQFDYFCTNYINYKNRISVKCLEHGIFSTSPTTFLFSKYGCPKCAIQKSHEKFKLSTQDFIKKAQKVHKDKYDYSLVDYQGRNKPISILCEKHGAFKTLPFNFLKGCGCPICKSSKGELRISKWLDEHNIVYEREKKFFELGNLRYDFYIPSKNLLIEYNGIQHYQFVPYFHRSLIDFRMQLKRDIDKETYALRTNRKLLVISYTYDIENYLSSVKTFCD